MTAKRLATGPAGVALVGVAAAGVTSVAPVGPTATMASLRKSGAAE